MKDKNGRKKVENGGLRVFSCNSLTTTTIQKQCKETQRHKTNPTQHNFTNNKSKHNPTQPNTTQYNTNPTLPNPTPTQNNKTQYNTNPNYPTQYNTNPTQPKYNTNPRIPNPTQYKSNTTQYKLNPRSKEREKWSNWCQKKILWQQPPHRSH